MDTTIEPLFDMEEPQPEQSDWYKRQLSLAIYNEDGTLTCSHCGDSSPNEAIFSLNHGIVFNGWCVTRLLCNNNANPTHFQWLAEHGFQPVDRFDKANWA